MNRFSTVALAIRTNGVSKAQTNDNTSVTGRTVGVNQR